MTNLLLLGFLPSGSEWIIIALVILLLFGGKKIPELMRGLEMCIRDRSYLVQQGFVERLEKTQVVVGYGDSFVLLRTL